MRKLAPTKLRLRLRRETLKVLPRAQLVEAVGGETKAPDRCLTLLVVAESVDPPAGCLI